MTLAARKFSGTSPDGQLVEFVEYPREQHPFFVATQAHPELKSRPTRPHPLFAASLPLSRLDTGISAAQLYGDAPWPQA